jgi:hypothetical protein
MPERGLTIGDDQRRPAGGEGQVLHHEAVGGGLLVHRVLADHDQVGVAGVQGHDRRDVLYQASVDPAFALEAGPVQLAPEPLGRLLGRLARVLAMLGQHVAGNLGRDEGRQSRLDDDVEARQVGVMGLGQGQRRLDAAGRGLGVVDVDQNVPVSHVRCSMRYGAAPVRPVIKDSSAGRAGAH